MPLPLTDCCFSKIQIGITFLVPTHPGSPGQSAVKRMCVCVCHIHVITDVGYEFQMIISGAFGALALLVGRQEEHPACKRLSDGVWVW